VQWKIGEARAICNATEAKELVASDAREQNGARIQGTIAPQEVVAIVVTAE